MAAPAAPVVLGEPKEEGKTLRTWRPTSEGKVKEDSSAPAPPAADEQALRPLVQQLEILEQKLKQRQAVRPKLEEEIERSRVEAVEFQRKEEGLWAEVERCNAQAESHNEVLASSKAELVRRLSEVQQKAEQKQDRSLADELEWLVHQQARAREQLRVLEEAAQRWGRSVEDRAERITKAEAKLKKLEGRKSELKSQSEQLQLHLAAHISRQDTARESRTQEAQVAVVAHLDEAECYDMLWQGLTAFLTVVLAYQIFTS